VVLCYPIATGSFAQGCIDRRRRLAVVGMKHVAVDRKRELGLAWPRRLLIVTISTPLAMSCETWLWRRLWNVISGIPIRSASSPQSDDRVLGRWGPPSKLGNSRSGSLAMLAAMRRAS
jgi:hypothetical protein